MTRDEAIQKVKTAIYPSGEFSVRPGAVLKDVAMDINITRRAIEAVDTAVALGLKLDEPKTVEQKAADALVGCEVDVTSIQVDLTSRPRTCLTPDGCADIVRHLQNCGFQIVHRPYADGS